MGCGCQGANGYVRVWQHVAGGKVLSEHDDQATAAAARTREGGIGRLQQVTKRVAK